MVPDPPSCQPSNINYFKNISYGKEKNIKIFYKKDFQDSLFFLSTFLYRYKKESQIRNQILRVFFGNSPIETLKIFGFLFCESRNTYHPTPFYDLSIGFDQ